MQHHLKGAGVPVLMNNKTPSNMDESSANKRGRQGDINTRTSKRPRPQQQLSSRHIAHALAIFGRLADHRAVCGCTYTADTDMDFSLWMNCRWSRRLKNEHPQWLPLFGGNDSDCYGEDVVTRADFGSRLRCMPFKYPLAASNRPVPVPADVRSAMTPLEDDELAGMRWSERARKTVQQWFDAVPLPDDDIDDVFELMGGKGGQLRRMTFETRILELANENFDLESDPVLEWDIFFGALQRRRAQGVSKGVCSDG